MDKHFRMERSSGRFPIVLYSAAIAVALGAAAIASTGALAPGDVEQPVLVVSGTHMIGPDRIASIIEPVAPAPVAVVQPAKVAPVADQAKPAAEQPEPVAALPPKPLRRPCLECIAPPATPVVATAQPVVQTPVDPAPAEAEYDVATAAPDGPVPPLPVGRVAGEGSERGLLVRSGEAVISGGSELVGTAWSLSGAAVGGLVRGVHQLTF
ncbi:hypothetical protein SAMN02745157_3071 [Kaistia soli DSM 19436]|uniref:Uncharacterized protein n=1 Tax=Kaistia soli DSM 19436 TaxID=1122133 RepID=A0A1M5FKL0_9HYPH|nr:hypothetical protein [Kaistia soli]SHF91672.1 hypothetical protein SAMN02745157_3071 [Kaistia soli DSM 19436]